MVLETHLSPVLWRSDPDMAIFFLPPKDCMTSAHDCMHMIVIRFE